MVSSDSLRGPVLLASASTGGTISAVRHLATHGFDVRVLSSQVLGAAAWSRGVTRCYSAPPERESKRFLVRLLEIGESDPGQNSFADVGRDGVAVCQALRVARTTFPPLLTIEFDPAPHP